MDLPLQGRHRFRRGLLCAAATVAIVAAPVATAARVAADSVSDYQHQAQQAQQQADALRKQAQQNAGQSAALGGRINSLTQIINALAVRQNQLRQAIAALDERIAAQLLAVASAQAELDRIGNDLAMTRAQLVRTQITLSHDRDVLAGILKRIYEMGTTSVVNAMLAAQDFNALWQKLIDQRRVANSEHDAVQAVRAAEAQVRGSVARITGDQQRQSAVLGQQQQIRLQLESTRQDRAALAAELAREIAVEDAQRRLNEQSKAQVDAEVAALQAAAAKAQKTADQKKRAAAAALAAQQSAARGHPQHGQFIWPMASGVITQDFGCSPYYFEPYDPNCPSRHYHSGIDYATGYGTTVVAAAAGTAYTFVSSYGYGDHVIIVNDDGVFSTLYGHLSGFAIRSGQSVRQGQPIGYEGSTGNSTGPHLHFEIRYNNTPQNPLAYLP